MSIHKVGNFSFYHGAVGVDNFDKYLKSIGTVDLIYSAPPNKSMISFWNLMSDKEGCSWEDMIGGFYNIILELNPSEIYIESNEFTEDLESFLSNNWPERAVVTKEIMYSAPTTKKGTGLCKRRVKTYITSCSINNKFNEIEWEYSHEFLGKILERKETLNCIDPFIGKGLLSRECLKSGNTCHGIEYNFDRIKSALSFIESGTK